MMAAHVRPATGWRGSTAARALVCWRDAQLQALALALERPLAAWCREWGLRVAEPVACQGALLLESGLDWRPLRLDSERAGWLHVPAGIANGLRAALFPGSAAAGRVAGEVASACQHDAVHRLLSTLGLALSTGSGEGPATDETGPWSGLVQVRLPSPLDLQWLLLPGAMAAWCRAHGASAAPPPPQSRQPLACVMDAVGGLPFKLEVQLDGCELDLAALQRLRPGDVVRMRHRIDAPATVFGDAGTPLFRAYLGRQAGSRAVGLAPLDAAPAQPVTQGNAP